MFRSSNLLLLILCVLAPLCSGCRTKPSPGPSYHSSYETPDTFPTITPKPAVAATNIFGFNLFHQLTTGSADNVFISPTSLMLALAMAYNGAGGETKAAMAKTLQISGFSDGSLNKQLAGLQKSLQMDDDRIQLITANSLWARPSLPFKPHFLDLCDRFYNSEVRTVDLGSRQAVTAINEWVYQKTNGLIPEILSETDLSVAAMLLLDAVYFKGYWTDEFDEGLTHKSKFALQSGRRKPVQMMMQEGHYLYAEDRLLQAIALPYGDRRLNMIVVLPRSTNGLPALQKRLDDQGWTALLARLAKMPGRIEFPRFEVKYEAYLNQALEKLGMGVAFTPQGDFSAMGDRIPGLAFAKQKTFLRVTEKKTEAAGALAAPPAEGAPSPPTGPFEMIVDHPFLLGIVDTKTGALLFLGAINDPQETRAGE